MDRATPAVAKPDHVPEALVFDFDMFADPLTARDPHEGHYRLLEIAPDIFWTPRNGGHWVSTRYADLAAIMRSADIFSSVDAPFERTQPLMGLPLPPFDMDAPDHMPHRRLLFQFLAPRALKALEPKLQQIIDEIVDGLEGRHGCAFTAEVAVPVPATFFTVLMQFDSAHSRDLFGWVNAIAAGGDRDQLRPALIAMNDYIARTIEERSADPGDDPISILLRSEVNGERLSVQRVHEMSCFLFLAGLDTVTKGMTFIMHHLARHPELQQRLRGAPDEIGGAVEELLRRFAFLNVVRRLTRDHPMGEAPLKAGDTIICSLAAASNDPRAFPEPDKLDFARKGPPHLAFNIGPHACAGGALARIELKMFLETWLRRIPDVSIAPDWVPRTRGGMVMSFEELPLVW